MNTILLSYIVPVFNTGPWLPKCLDSLLAQDLPADAYEILLTYDEGSENGLDICQDYAARYPQIRLLTHSNRTMGASFNYSLQFVRGKYLQLIDSDDYIEQGITSLMLDKMERENLDILRCNYRNVNEQYEEFNPYKTSHFDDYHDEVCDGETFLNTRMGVACYIPTFIFRSDLVLREGNIMTDLIINDTEWLPRIVIQGKRVSSIEQVGYNYLFRTSSTMRTPTIKRRKELLEDSLQLLVCMQEQVHLVYNDSWYQRQISGIVVTALTTVGMCFYDEREHYMKFLRERQVCPIDTSHISRLQARMKLWLINISPRLYVFIMHKLS